MWPLFENEAVRHARAFHEEYERYRQEAVSLGAVPESADVILEESRRTSLSALAVLGKRRRARLRSDLSG